MLQITIFGANGRMGQTLLRLIAAADDLSLAGALTEPGHADIGRDAGELAGAGSLGISLSDDPQAALADAGVAIDFTLPAATADNLAACAQAKVPLVLGTTGLDAETENALAAAAAALPIVYGRNMSVGVNLLTELVRLAAATLGNDYDIEISETHHRHKLDAPSGTALQLGEAAAQGRGVALDSVAVAGRQGRSDARVPGSIGFASLRAGSVVGDHSVMFAADEEVLDLSHRALDRAVFARGALRAARWLPGKAPGLYGMRAVLGLSD